MMSAERTTFLRRLRRHVGVRREHIRSKPTLNTVYRLGLGILGFAVLITGIVMIPYPGPGWLVVFAGLGILATEFAWAHRVNTGVKHRYASWVDWVRRQNLPVRIGLATATGAVVLVTGWLVGMFGLLSDWLGLGWHWLNSPFTNR